MAHPFLFLRSCIHKRRTQWEQTFQYPKVAIVFCHMLSFPKLCCNFPNHCPSVLSDKHVNILLTVFRCQLFMPEHVCVSSIQLPSGTTGTHGGISVHMMKLPTDIRSWVVPHEAFNYCTWLRSYFVDSQSVTVDCKNTNGMCTLSLYLYGADTPSD